MAGRIIAQMLVMGAQVFGKAGMQAYKQAVHNAKAGGVSTVRRGMQLSEARQVLNIENTATAVEVEERFEKYFNQNQPGKDHMGSPYLQQKITIARDALIEDLKPKEEPKAEEQAKGPSESPPPPR
eukprot:TRINITY_DN2005_c0_g1_i2.p1 TRINITY_DN2005_c0_g1~~TRINITY_DN2005_c0_g1_i2.p1  ORF type:complete len:126 (-),score=32.45 TRINITY_DN2005_c0_g1_i2:266-643(-)